MLDGKILTDMTSGACFGEIAFLATCKKVLRQHGCNDNLAVRVCDVRAEEVVRLVELTVRDFLLVVEPSENTELLNVMLDLEIQAQQNESNLQSKLLARSCEHVGDDAVLAEAGSCSYSDSRESHTSHNAVSANSPASGAFNSSPLLQCAPSGPQVRRRSSAGA